MTFLGRDELGILRDYSAAAIDASSSSTVTFLGRDANGILRNYTPAQLATATSGALLGRDSNGLLRDYTAAEINATTTDTYVENVRADNSVAWWRFGESSGNPQDAIGTNHVTVVGGTPTYGVAGALAGDSDTAITLDGATEYFSAPDANALDLGDVLSVEAWIKTSTKGRWVVGKAVAGAYGLGTNATTGVLEWMKAGVDVVAASSVAVTDGGWHHIVATKNGATRNVYVDGVDVTVLGTNATFVNTAGALIIGRYPNSSTGFWNGTLDEVALYGTALSAARVLAHYNAGVT